MRLIFVPDPEQKTSGYHLLVQDGSGKTKWGLRIACDSRVDRISIAGIQEASAELMVHHGIFSTRAEYSTISGDRITVRRSRGKLPAFEGSDWVVKGKEYPEEFYIDAGYGKIATVRGRDRSTSAPDLPVCEGFDSGRFLQIVIDCSLTAIPLDVVCGVFAILALQDK